MKLKMTIFIGVLSLAIMFTACSKKQVSDDLTAKLNDYSVESMNDGGEDSQYVLIQLHYDREVQVNKNAFDGLKVTIGGVKMGDSQLHMESGDDAKTVIIKISINSVTEGQLIVSSESKQVSGITTVVGNYPAAPINISCLVPSGVQIDTVQQIKGSDTEQATTTVEVTHGWDIRGILWLKLMEDGQAVSEDEGASVSKLDDAIGVHGHEFLMLSDTANAAKNIVDELQSAYGVRYDFQVDQNRITITSKETGEKEIDLEVYCYTD